MNTPNQNNNSALQDNYSSNAICALLQLQEALKLEGNANIRQKLFIHNPIKDDYLKAIGSQKLQKYPMN